MPLVIETEEQRAKRLALQAAKAAEKTKGMLTGSLKGMKAGLLREEVEEFKQGSGKKNKGRK
jgi:hypothetical protein